MVLKQVGIAGMITLGSLLGGTNLTHYSPLTKVEAATYYPTLQIGSSGYYVSTLQQLLNRKGFSVTIDGYYGPQTAAVVKWYQWAHGLQQDGVCGPITWSSILAAPDSKPPQPAIKGVTKSVTLNSWLSNYDLYYDSAQTATIKTRLESIKNNGMSAVNKNGISFAETLFNTIARYSGLESLGVSWVNDLFRTADHGKGVVLHIRGGLPVSSNSQ